MVFGSNQFLGQSNKIEDKKNKIDKEVRKIYPMWGEDFLQELSKAMGVGINLGSKDETDILSSILGGSQQQVF